MAMLPSSVVEAVETVLKSQDGVMKKWGQVQEILLGAKLAYQQVFPPCLFMVHPLNRGGTGVNPYSCHRKGGAIVAAGADLQQLGGAVAFELSTDEATRSSFNLILTKLQVPKGCFHIQMVKKDSLHAVNPILFCFANPYKKAAKHVSSTCKGLTRN